MLRLRGGGNSKKIAKYRSSGSRRVPDGDDPMDTDYRPRSKRTGNQVESASDSEPEEGDEEGEEEEQQEDTDDTNADDEEGEEGDGEEGVEGEEEGEEEEEGGDGGDEVEEEESDDGGLVFNPNWEVRLIKVSNPPDDRMDRRGSHYRDFHDTCKIKQFSQARSSPTLHFHTGTSTTFSGATSRLGR